jgi:hypothetical protein
VNWNEVFLGVIAAATLVMALVQVGAIVAILRVTRQAQQEIRPLVTKVSAVADEASRAAAIATAQAQKVDHLLSDLSGRIEETAAVVQQAIVMPAREGLAIMAALKAGLAALRGFRERPRHGRTADEEDPLFIG